MHRQFSDIPAVVVLTGLEIKSTVLFVQDRVKMQLIPRQDRDLQNVVSRPRLISGTTTLVNRFNSQLKGSR